MSSRNSHGRGRSASQRLAFDAQSQQESNIDPRLDSSLFNIDNGMGNNDFTSSQTGQGMAQSPIGGNPDYSTPGYPSNMQGNTGFVPHTPTPPMKRQISGNGSASFATPQKTQYGSPSMAHSSVGAPYTPRQYNNSGVLNSPYQNSSRGMAPSPLGMSVSTNVDRFQNHNDFSTTLSPQVHQGFSNMGTTPQYRGTHSSNDPVTMLNSPQGREGMMAIANVTQQRGGQQMPHVSNGSSNAGAGAFGSGFNHAVFTNQEHNWMALGGGDQPGLGDGQFMAGEESQFGNARQPFASARYPSPDGLAHQSVGYQTYQHATDDYEEEEEAEEDQNESDSDEDSEYEAEKGTPSTVNTTSHSTPSGANQNVSKYQGIIQSESDYKALLAKRAKAAKDLVSKGRQDTCPTQNDEICERVHELFDAIMNTDGIVDKKAQDGRKAQAARRLDDNYYSAEVVEIACWEMFVSHIVCCYVHI